jgi:hypothetical protein
MRVTVTLLLAAIATATANDRSRLLKKQAPVASPPSPVASPVANPVPVPVPVPVPTPVAFPVAVVTPVGPAVPQNCCEFLSQMVALDNACMAAATQGALGLALQTFQLSQATCQVTTGNVLALQTNFLTARTNFRNYLVAVRAGLTPVKQDCFNVAYKFPFNCELYKTDFSTQTLPKNYNSLKDLVCCPTAPNTGVAAVIGVQNIYDPNIFYPVSSGALLTKQFCDGAIDQSSAETPPVTPYAGSPC